MGPDEYPGGVRLKRQSRKTGSRRKSDARVFACEAHQQWTEGAMLGVTDPNGVKGHAQAPGLRDG